MAVLRNPSPVAVLSKQRENPHHWSASSPLAALPRRPSITPASSSLSPKHPLVVHRNGLTALQQHHSGGAPLSSPDKGEESLIIRRQTNYHPTLWDHDFIQSLPTPNKALEAFTNQMIEVMKEKLVHMFGQENEPLQKMNLIDAIQRLGLAYHFKKEIKKVLQQVYDNGDTNDNLYATALRFRLLRQAGYHVPSDIFDKFKDKNGKFNPALGSDIRGLLSLYEASHCSINGEDILDEALSFTSEHLKSLPTHVDPSLARHIENSLALSLQKGMSRPKAMHYISFYEEDEGRNDILLELAKLDFNQIQSLHQREIKEVSKWSQEMDFRRKLAFGRDRVVEAHEFALELNSLPQFSIGRIALSKFVLIIGLLDDIYDAYGTLDELELFTDIIDRWDSSSMDQLPYYMKLCFLSIYNLFNEIEYTSLRDRGSGFIYYLKKTLAGYCQAMMQEARWSYDGRVPSFDEYLRVTSATSSGHILIVISTIGMKELATTEALDYIRGSMLLRLVTLNARLINDLATSKEEQVRGDGIKIIQCYMKEKDVSEEEARIYISNLIIETWKEINKELLKPNSLPEPIVNCMVNFVRVFETVYLNKTDGVGNSKCWTMDRINSMFFEPLPL